MKLTQTVDFWLTDINIDEPVCLKKPFYTLLKSSICRRTFCTMLFKDGWALDDIIPFSGHSNVTTLLHYIKYGQEPAQVVKLLTQWDNEEW